MPLRTHNSVAHALPIFVLRIVQLVFAICVIGLLGYIAYYYNYYFAGYSSVYSGAIGLGIFTACVTLIANVYYLVAALSVHKAYHPIAVLTLDAFLVLFWLITFALCAKSTADFHAYDNASASSYAGSDGGTYVTSGGHTYECFADGDCYLISKRATSSSTSTWTAVFAASLALSILEWFMFIATLVLIALGYHRTRATTGPATSTPATTTAVANEKGTTAPVVGTQPTQTYDQQYAQPQYTQPTHYTEGSELPQQAPQQQYAQPQEYHQTYAQPGQQIPAQQTYTHPQ